MNKQELIDLVDSLRLLKSEYYILSSGCLLLYGLRDYANDLDLCITEKLFKDIKTKYDLTDEKKNACGFYKINDMVEAVVAHNEPFIFDIKDGYQVQKLEKLLEYKKQAMRQKDLPDIEKITEYLKNRECER